MSNNLLIIPVRLTKADIEATGNALVEQTLERGTTLQDLLALNAAKQVLEDAIAKLRPHAITEAVKYKGQTIAGVKVEVVNGAGRYDYSHDATWADLKARLKKREEQMQGALALGSQYVVDPETGEQTPAAVYTAGAETVKITFPKS